jgi:hypothetical protein
MTTQRLIITLVVLMVLWVLLAFAGMGAPELIILVLLVAAAVVWWALGRRNGAHAGES